MKASRTRVFLKRIGLVGLMLASAVSVGCSLSTKQVIIYPISQTDIVVLDAGDSFTAPKSGAFLSDFYLEEVARARVGR